VASAKAVPELVVFQPPAVLPPVLCGENLELFMKPEKRQKQEQPTKPQFPTISNFPVPELPNWKQRLKQRANNLGRVQKADIWSLL
jgi:hypothetical protein